MGTVVKLFGLAVGGFWLWPVASSFLARAGGLSVCGMSLPAAKKQFLIVVGLGCW